MNLETRPNLAGPSTEIVAAAWGFYKIYACTHEIYNPDTGRIIPLRQLIGIREWQWAARRLARRWLEQHNGTFNDGMPR